MKKVRILLASLAVIAAIGTTVAVKASYSQTTLLGWNGTSFYSAIGYNLTAPTIVAAPYTLYNASHVIVATPGEPVRFTTNAQ